MNGPRLHGERVYLREIKPEDGGDLIAWRNSAEVRRGLYAQPDLIPEAQDAWFQGYLQDPGQVRFIIESREMGPVGSCGLTGRKPLETAANLTIIIGEALARGKGLARESLDLLLDYGFGQWGLHRVTAEVFDDNQPALKLYARVGFVEEGRMRKAHRDAVNGTYTDVVIMGLLQEEWESR